MSLTETPHWGYHVTMQTVAETLHYSRKAEKILTGAEREEVIEILAHNPLAGAVMSGTGGIRKMRFARAGRGKSGGVRVIYYVYNEAAPIYLLDVFGKNEKANLSKAERNDLAKLAVLLKQAIRGQS